MYFPDNTVLINFAIIGEMDTLKKLLNGKGAWVGAVHAECEDSHRKGYYPGIEEAFDFMPDPILVDKFEEHDARTIRLSITDVIEDPAQSLGESQTIAVVTHRHIEAVFITDDGGAIKYIKDEHLPIAVCMTTDLLALAVRAGFITEATAEAHIKTLVARGRKRISINRFRKVLKKRST